MTKTLDDFAIFGGTALFETPLHVNRPWAGDRQRFGALVDDIWSSGRFTNDGPLVQRLERILADRLQVAACVLTSNGTAALAVLLQAMGVRGEVILPSFTFISSPHTLTLGGIKPVFCDVEPPNWNISVAHCESLITDKTAAILPTHLWSRACDTGALETLSQRTGIPVIYDAAHAFGCSHRGRTIGSFGQAEVFSFHATKAFHTGEGGAVTCGDPVLAAELRTARNFGFVGADKVSGIGTNAKMSELSAAMGLANLAAYDGSVAANREVYEAYRDALRDVPHIRLLPFDDDETGNYWYISAVLDADSPIARDDIVDILWAENVLARRYFHPGCHRMQPYARDGLVSLSNTEDIAARCLILPGGSGMAVPDVQRLCGLLETIMENATLVLDRLPGRVKPCVSGASS